MSADAIATFTIIVGLAAFFYGPWQSFCVDLARQFMFEQRDAMFDIARGGGISFQSRQYREIRSSMERSIRFAHELTLPRLLYLMVAPPRQITSTSSDMKKAVEAIADETTRRAIHRLAMKSTGILVLSLAARSLLVWLFLPFLLLVLVTTCVFVAARHYVKSSVRRVWEIVQKESEIYG